jgi:hypothetical protein
VAEEEDYSVAERVPWRLAGRLAIARLLAEA